MDKNIEKLLSKIELEKDFLHYFEDGSIKRVVARKNQQTYTFHLILKETLPINVYKIFLNKIKKAFTEYNVNIRTEAKTKKHIEDYINDFFGFVNADQSISIENTKFKLKISSVDESLIDKINKEKDKLKEFLIDTGFEEKEIVLKLEKKIVETINSAITDEVITVYEKTEKTSKKEEKNIIYGEKITEEPEIIKNVISETANITIEGYVFDEIDVRKTKTNWQIITIKVSDYTDSIYIKVFVDKEELVKKLQKNIKKGNWYLFKGSVKYDSYSKELVFNPKSINISDKKGVFKEDLAPLKRIELHAHTMMSQMDGVVNVEALIDRAIQYGHKAIAITDHNGCQSFPEAYRKITKYNKGKEEKFKVIYGAELTLIDDSIDIIKRPNNTELIENTYVVFDFETTGFNAGNGDTVIEIGAVKLFKGKIIDKFSELINPGRKLPKKITEITGITDAMLDGKDDEKTVMQRFIEWFKDLPMIAHNAKFDVSFLEMAYKKYKFGEFKNTLIDTLELSRALDKEFSRHSLSALVKRYNIPFDENSHHRGDYDAEATALVFNEMMKKLLDRHLKTLDSMDKIIEKDEIHKFGVSYHVNLLAKNKVGLKNLFNLISLANTKYLYKTPRILRSEINRLREGLLVGSGCADGEVFKEARSKSEEEIVEILNFYDYVEVQPIDCYDHLVQMTDFENKAELINHVNKIIKVCEEAKTIVVATGDVHHIDPEDKIYRKIIVNQKVPGGGRHPLARDNIKEIPSLHFRTTEEMLDDFAFLGEIKAQELVIDNPNKLAEEIDFIEVIRDTNGKPFAPIIENSAEITREYTMKKARELYGENLPLIVEERLDKELKGIIGAKYDVIYLIAQKLVKKSNDDGYLVGSRGSVGSSFVATMMGITEVNPLPPHYICGKCQHSEFEDDKGTLLSESYLSGYDLPNKKCPKCGENMGKEGNDLPFATFLGFNADKVPDIDLNFSDLNQAATHDYTKELFGEDKVYRAGTIGTVADKTAFGFVKGYCEDKGIMMRGAEIERLAIGCTGIKRTTGQHPGGIVVIPNYMDVLDFTPFQFPADDSSKQWRTTHFEYHSLEDNLLKLDILGHTDPTQLRMLQDITGIDVTKIPFDDKKTMDIFLSPKSLGVTKEQIMCETGTLGVPEFGTPFTIGMLVDTKPKSFAALTKISGLSHGIDVWLGNAQELIKNKIVPFSKVIGCRDDIMIYLMGKGLEPLKAFKIMEFVRKGKASKEPEQWAEFKKIMQEAKIEDWYIDSCEKIQYMFPKAHAVAYVMSAFRIAYFKVHYPIVYYATYFSTRFFDFDMDVMMNGYSAIRNKIIEIQNKGYEATNKETAVLETLKLSLEMCARGFEFGNIDLYKSHSKNFIIDPSNEKILIPPFRTIEGLGETVAEKIVEEREKQPFLSIEDLAKRAKISTTVIDKLRTMKVLDAMDESSQMSLF